ncbi:1,4-dihydroxy-2-naphthoate polyprenyltransferase [bacterium]|nr:1,4-dihydroxy-2-naphthoate polyprenyltransferase [bacterium]MBU1984150.1 1,4-dihydroxy-2-naphthoate polyprenyltransferase [bacterium]
MSSLKVWLLASRPKTLVAAIVPVVVGAAYASRFTPLDPFIVACIAVSALCIQIGTNFANDYSDHQRGADVLRQGPTRVTQSGLAKPAHVKRAAVIVFALAVLLGVPLVVRGGWPILLIGVLGILCGWAYTGGPFPFGYRGLGELFVFLFFGLAAVMGTTYLLTLEWHPPSALIAIPSGLHASALLAVNNLRDIESDCAAGKRTLAVMMGHRFAQWEFALFCILPFAVPVALFFHGFANPILLPLLSLPLLILPIGIVVSRNEPTALIRALGATARLQLVFGILFAVGLALCVFSK